MAERILAFSSCGYRNITVCVTVFYNISLAAGGFFMKHQEDQEVTKTGANY